MLKIIASTVCFLFFSMPLLAHEKKHHDDHHASTIWQKITPSKSIDITDVDGNIRTIHPSCSGGPTPYGTLDSSEYSFFFKQGKDDKLLVFFEGGGACWDAATCNSSISAEGAYISTLIQTDPQALNGIFDQNNHDNPFRKYSIVYLPYCTGDIHSGSRDTQYPNVFGLPDADGNVLSTITIHHRGFDNFLAARHWLGTRFNSHHVEHLVVAGNSAGSYGAALAINHLSKDFSNADTSLILDSGDGIVIDEFVSAAMTENGSWGYTQNIPQWTSGIGEVINSGFANPFEFSSAFFGAIAMNNPQVKISQFSTSWDAVQTLFYNIMNVQAASGSPQQWTDLSAEVYASWIINNNISLNILSSAANYRFFLAPGCEHTMLRGSRLYTIESAGVKLSDWLDAAVDDDDSDSWLNVPCIGASCLPPVPTTEEEVLALRAQIGACIQSALPEFQ